MEIEACKKFEPKKSMLCNWCQYQVICPEWKHKFDTEKLPANKYLKESGVVLANKYIELKNKEKEIQGELEELREAVITYAKEKGYNVIMGSDGKLSISQTETTRLPRKDTKEYEELEKVIKKLNAWDDCTSLDQTKIKEYLKTNNNNKITGLLEKSTITMVRVGKK